MVTILKRPRPGLRARPAAPRRVPAPGLPVRALRQRHGLSQALLARLLDVSLRTLSALESGAIPVVPPPRNLTQTARLCEALAQRMEAQHVGRWLDEPNELLAGLKPLEAIERGQLDLVWQAVEGLRSGSQL